MNFTIGKTIGKGGQAEVVHATWNDQEYAIKLFQEDSVFQKELEVMKHNWSYLPTCHWVLKVREKYQGIVMPLYGIDVRKHIKNYFLSSDRPTLMTESKVKDLGIRMLRWIEQLHSIGYIHWDIKPENFVYTSNRDDEKNIVLIDFGMAHKFIDSQKGNRHISYGKADDFKGTPSFSSISALKGYIQSRRDDLESLAYLLMYASYGELPWQKYRVIEDYEEKINKIIESKSNVFSFDFIKEIPECLLELLKYWRSLQFREKPDYKYIASLFQTEEISEVKHNNPFKLLVEEKEESKDEEKKALIVFNKMDRVSDRSITPNNSYTDREYIKSFSFIRDRSNKECVVSKFKVYSDVSVSQEEESGESESSVSSQQYEGSNLILKGGDQITKQDHSYVDKQDAISIFSGFQGTKPTDTSPCDTKFMFSKASNIDLRKQLYEDLSKDVRFNCVGRSNSKNISQKSFLFLHQSSNKINMIGENDDILYKHLSKFLITFNPKKSVKQLLCNLSNFYNFHTFCLHQKK